LGNGKTQFKGVAQPKLVEELTFTKFTQVRAGQFSGALAADQSLYIWGEGIFGKYHTPKRLKLPFPVSDFQISRGGHACILTSQ
jgi:alpha-tubulin suppressor-like RCC1 family protein